MNSQPLRTRLAALIYLVCGVVSVVMGAIYLFRGTFMPYHSVAISRSWEELPEAEQVLFNALLDVAGAAWATVGLLTIVLTAIPFRNRDTWARWTLPIANTLMYVPILLATLAVLEHTPASPPWYGNALALSMLALAVALDQPWRAGDEGNDK